MDSPRHDLVGLVINVEVARYAHELRGDVEVVAVQVAVGDDGEAQVVREERLRDIGRYRDI